MIRMLLDIAEDMAACKLPVSQTVCISPLWREDIRDKVTVSKLTDQQIHTLRAEHLVPGNKLKGSKYCYINRRNEFAFTPQGLPTMSAFVFVT